MSSWMPFSIVIRLSVAMSYHLYCIAMIDALSHQLAEFANAAPFSYAWKTDIVKRQLLQLGQAVCSMFKTSRCYIPPEMNTLQSQRVIMIDDMSETCGVLPNTKSVILILLGSIVHLVFRHVVSLSGMWYH